MTASVWNPTTPVLSAIALAILASTSPGEGGNLIGFIQEGTGAKADDVTSAVRDTGIRVNGFENVDPDGNSDSYAGIMAAIAATPAGGTLVLNGYYRSSQGIEFPKNIKIKGKDSRIGNLSDYSQSSSVIVFDSPVAAALYYEDVQLTLEDVVIVSSVSGSAKGVHAEGGNSSLIMKEGSVVQGFDVGLYLNGGDYHKIEGTVTFCGLCIQAIDCYNLVLKAPTLRATGASCKGIALSNGCSATLSGGSIENFNEYGVALFAGSSLTMLGTYFEGLGGPNVLLGPGAAINTMGCHVYLNTGTTHWMKLDGGATGVRIFSRAHRFEYPTDTSTVVLYDLKTDDPLAFSDIAGDPWPSPIGANVSYLSAGTFSGAGPVALMGAHTVIYPMGHPLAHKNICTVPQSLQPAVSAVSGTPPATMYLPFAAQGFAGDDPIGLRLANGGVWGAHAYMAIYQKGQWEKIGLRMANQADSTATTVAGIVADHNALLAKLRAAGVMV